MLNNEIQKQLKLFETYLDKYAQKNWRVFASSSFQTHSIPMLHIISSIDKSIPIYFLNTGYHFPESLEYRDQITNLYNLNLVDLRSTVDASAQRDSSGKLLFATDPDHCCYINKTAPMDSVLSEFDVWITGVRRDQNANRKNFSIESGGPKNTTRFHPMLDWNNKMIFEYISHFKIPKHPLEKQGYLSIGCAPCTKKFDLTDPNNRGGRWAGLKKTECGLHTDLASN